MLCEGGMTVCDHCMLRNVHDMDDNNRYCEWCLPDAPSDSEGESESDADESEESDEVEVDS